MALQQTLKNLCSKSGWCYAVFWKLKRRSRMVLTWEDVYYELQSSDAGDTLRCLESGGNSLCQGASLDGISYSRRQIGLAVAKMSYCVYFMGEGIIGRVAFTGKHQWVFADSDRRLYGTAFGSTFNNQCTLEKYPSSWEVQFAAGIKTIAIVAVQQGVVQLGSTETIPESIEWVDHVKSAFSVLQNLQGAVGLSEGQGGLPSACFAKGSCKANPSQSSPQGSVGVPAIGFQSLAVYGADQTMCASGQPNTQGMTSSIEQLRSLPSMAQRGESVQPLNIQMGSMCMGSTQSSEAIATASNSQAFSLYEDVKQDFRKGEIRGMHLSKSLDRLQFVQSFGRVFGPCVDADILTSFDEQSNKSSVLPQCKILDPGSFLPLQSAGEQSLHQVEDATLSSFYQTVNMSEIPRVPGDLVGPVAGNHDAYVGKIFETQELSSDSVVGNMLHKIAFDEISPRPCSADPMNMSEDSGDKSLMPGGGDLFETHLASFTQGRSSNNKDCSFVLGDELSQALGPSFYGNHSKDRNLLDGEHRTVAADQPTSGKMCPLSELSAAGLSSAWGLGLVKSKPQVSESKPESLLDAVVASASSSHLSISTAADDSPSCRTFSARDDESSAAMNLKANSTRHVRSHSSQKCMPQGMVHVRPVDYEGSVSNHAFSNVLHDTLSFNTSAPCPPLKTILSSWTDDIQSIRSDSTQTSQLKKSEDPVNKGTRKRARPGESTRPRPKDRQQIQDRVRELREIVPNGSKCSIDALLEKTIKHMLFLQNVTLHADNLKKNGELKDDVENGASWALELGGEDTDRPPILVKNLNQPRQFLVEMFCEEKGHFLEIADIIRSLGLMILKGVMESRSDKIWARFVVEANRDIRRVDIMLPLMHLLHVNNNSGSSMTIGSQTAPVRSHIGVECSSSSQSKGFSGFPQPSSLHV